MLSRLARVPQRLPLGARCMSEAAKPMTRFIQYPFDKTKMAEVREWANSSGVAKELRSIPGVNDLEVSFCPGEGWLAARYIFNDLEDLKGFADSDGYKKGLEIFKTAPHADPSRSPHEFKGFYLKEV
jgi:hypothetical protein